MRAHVSWGPSRAAAGPTSLDPKTHVRGHRRIRGLVAATLPCEVGTSTTSFSRYLLCKTAYWPRQTRKRWASMCPGAPFHPVSSWLHSPTFYSKPWWAGRSTMAFQLGTRSSTRQSPSRRLDLAVRPQQKAVQSRRTAGQSSCVTSLCIVATQVHAAQGLSLLLIGLYFVLFRA